MTRVVLFHRVAVIRERRGERVFQHRGGLVDANAMLLDVRLMFRRVPGELHFHSIRIRRSAPSAACGPQRAERTRAECRASRLCSQWLAEEVAQLAHDATPERE